MRPPQAVGHIPRLAACRAAAPPSSLPPPTHPPTRPPSSCPRNPRRAGPLANNITTFTAGVAASLPVRGVAAQLQSAAAVGHSSAIATVATVSAALESTWGRDRCAHAPAALHQGCCRAAGRHPAPACAAHREPHSTAFPWSTLPPPTRAAARPRPCCCPCHPAGCPRSASRPPSGSSPTTRSTTPASSSFRWARLRGRCAATAAVAAAGSEGSWRAGSGTPRPCLPPA